MGGRVSVSSRKNIPNDILPSSYAELKNYSDDDDDDDDDDAKCPGLVDDDAYYAKYPGLVDADLDQRNNIVYRGRIFVKNINHLLPNGDGNLNVCGENFIIDLTNIPISSRICETCFYPNVPYSSICAFHTNTSNITSFGFTQFMKKIEYLKASGKDSINTTTIENPFTGNSGRCVSCMELGIHGELCSKCNNESMCHRLALYKPELVFSEFAEQFGSGIHLAQYKI